MLYFTRWKALAIILIAPVVCLFAVPIFSPAASVKASAQSQPEPGLDPNAGSSLLLEVDSGYVRKIKLEQTRDDVRRALRDARIGYQGLAAKSDAVELRIADETKLPAALAKLSELLQPLGPNEPRSPEIADAGGG